MMQAVLTLVITADTKQQLDTDTQKIRSLSGRCQLAVLKYQQIDGLNTVLPIGTRKINAFRTLTTESLAVFMPSRCRRSWTGAASTRRENAISHNLIMCNQGQSAQSVLLPAGRSRLRQVVQCERGNCVPHSQYG